MPPKFTIPGESSRVAEFATAITRRGFMKAGGALFVSLAVPGLSPPQTYPFLLSRMSWIPANSLHGSSCEVTVRFWRAPAVQKSAPA